MKRKLQPAIVFSIVVIVLAFSSSCKKRSSVTNFKYNDAKWGGFEAHKFAGQATGPNLVLVQGGTFTQGWSEQDVTFEYNNIARRVTVSSFYIDETEISNLQYREYVYWVDKQFEDFPEVIRNSLPDTLVWREELAFNEPYVQYYLRHPSYQNYPVVGVSWLQASEFCKWRSDRVNEMILAEKKYIELNVLGTGEDNFTGETYMTGQYTTGIKKGKKDYSPNATDPKMGRTIRMEDGIIMPDYRLPTEAEWEYAALGLIGNRVPGNEMISDRRIYPWDGTSLRQPSAKEKWAQGKMLANFKRGRGDYAGIAGKLNDNAIVTSPVYSFMPNDYGVYNMAGNVNEWVADVYRAVTYADMEDLNPYRGNEYQVRDLDEDSYPLLDSLGRIKYRPVKDEESVNRRNYKKGYVVDYLDGDSTSSVTYEYGKSTLISDNARVYKGGSWADEAFWCSPGSRRYLEEDLSTATIGFRCAMIRLGGDVDNETKGGNHFKKTKKQKKANKTDRNMNKF